MSPGGASEPSFEAGHRRWTPADPFTPSGGCARRPCRLCSPQRLTAETGGDHERIRTRACFLIRQRVVRVRPPTAPVPVHAHGPAACGRLHRDRRARTSRAPMVGLLSAPATSVAGSRCLREVGVRRPAPETAAPRQPSQRAPLAPRPFALTGVNGRSPAMDDACRRRVAQNRRGMERDRGDDRRSLDLPTAEGWNPCP
jgi:hypothetical protein